jgi:DNA-binding transcriptional ArsR family regulator
MAKQTMRDTIPVSERRFSRFFKAFGDPTRLKILTLLAEKELAVADIVKGVGLAQPTISRHLAILRDADIVHDRREGQQVFYSLNKDVVAGCCTGFCNCLQIKVVREDRKKKK